MNYLCKVGIKKIFFLIKNKKISNVELTKICLNNLKKTNIKNNFNYEIFYKESINFAKKNDKNNNFSIPISIKNIYNLKKKICSCNSKILKNYISNYDSYIVKVLKKNYLNIISSEKLDEFCVGSCGLNNCNLKNLFNKNFIVGGSTSGGSLNLSFSCSLLSLGSDTGGSVRTPSSYCNLIGFKPTNGSISRYGMIPYSSLLDNCSIISNNVEDCEYLFNILKYKNNDLFSNKKNIFLINCKKNISILNYKEFYVDFEIKKIFEKLIINFEKFGFKILNLKKICFFSYNNIYNIYSSKDFFSNSSKFDGLKYGFKKKIFKDSNDLFKLNRIFSNNNKEKILNGSNFLNLKLNFNLNDILYFKKLFKFIFLKSNYFIIITNIKHYKIKDIYNQNIDLFTTYSNLLGYPSINIKLGFINHLPIGFQIFSEKNTDLELLKISKIIESLNFNNYVFN